VHTGFQAVPHSTSTVALRYFYMLEPQPEQPTKDLSPEPGALHTGGKKWSSNTSFVDSELRVFGRRRKHFKA
jgi:hypothetical protein